MKKKNILLWIIATAFLFIGTMSAKDIYADGAYGDDAYYYMQYLQDNYPNRAVAYPALDGAASWLKSEITTMGYEYESQPFSIPVGEGIIITGENISFSKIGASNQVIVVGAHYDSVLTRGTDDNATGVGLLLETASRLSSNQALPYTVRFVLFSAEEPGCYGSQYYVDQLSQEERDRILCMINLDTLGAGDYMYLYGGGLDAAGQPVRTWVVEQALEASQALELSMSFHPDVNPSYPVPTKYTASDQQAFDRIGVPYLYFEASNWNGADYNNFYQTSNPAVENGKMMHVEAYENLDFYNSVFEGRIYAHLQAYSRLLDYLLNSIIPNSSTCYYEYAEVNETVYAISDVYIRSLNSTLSDGLGILKAGESVQRIGYHEGWSKVLYDSKEAYIKTEYLTEQSPTEEIQTEEVQTKEPKTEEMQTEIESETDAEFETESDIAAGTESEVASDKSETTIADVKTSVKDTKTEIINSGQITEQNGINVTKEWLDGQKNSRSNTQFSLFHIDSHTGLKIVVIVGLIGVAVMICLFLILIFKQKKK